MRLGHLEVCAFGLGGEGSDPVAPFAERKLFGKLKGRNGSRTEISRVPDFGHSDGNVARV